MLPGTKIKEVQDFLAHMETIAGATSKPSFDAAANMAFQICLHPEHWAESPFLLDRAANLMGRYLSEAHRLYIPNPNSKEVTP